MAEEARSESEGVYVETVQLDGLALLKIIRHCEESRPEVVRGTLLGLDMEETLQVTACFPLPSDSAESDSYSLEMMSCLRGVNVDSYTVGWYQSSYLSSYLSEAAIDIQFDYQETVDKCVCIVYDPVLSTNGGLAVKALRLTDKFMEIYRSRRQLTKDLIRKSAFSSSEVFEEVPIEIQNLALVEGAIFELTQNAKLDPPTKLDLDSGAVLTRTMEGLIDSLDVLSSEHSKLQYHQRNINKIKAQQDHFRQRKAMEYEAKRAAGEDVLEEDLSNHPLFRPVPEPNRLEAVLATAQIDSQCAQVNELAAQALSKVFLVDALNKECPQA